MIKHLFIDMDGVLCDFVKAASNLHGQEYVEENWPKNEWYMERVLKISTEDFWNKINEQGSQFWKELAAFSWNEELINTIENMNIEWTICTTPSRSSNCVKGKVEWLYNAFGEKFRRYSLGEQKFLYGQYGHVLLDDNDINCSKFRDYGGEAIVFPQPWNSRNAECGSRLEVIIKDLQRMNDE